jgi:hypothetical protein
MFFYYSILTCRIIAIIAKAKLAKKTIIALIAKKHYFGAMIAKE